MLYALAFETPVEIVNAYRITRKTVWRAVDESEILIFVLEGACRFEIDGAAHDVHARQAILIPAGQRYVRTPLEDAPCTFIYFHFTARAEVSVLDEASVRSEVARRKAEWEHEAVPERSTGLLGLPTLYLPRLASLGVEEVCLAEEALSALSQGYVESLTRASLLFSLLLTAMMSAALRDLITGEAGRVSGPIPHKLRQAVQYIRQHYTSHISLAELCAHVGLSPQHLSRLFSRELGMTPVTYINRQRTARARMLINDFPQLSMKEIAYELGFDNPHYFSRLFARLEGESPTAVRERVRAYREQPQSAATLEAGKAK